MEILGLIVDICLMLIAVILVMISRFEYGQERLESLMWAAILLAWVGI